MIKAWLQHRRNLLREFFWFPTHVHLKTGGTYRVLMTARLEKTLETVVVYRNRNGDRWVRPALEFYDGRFAHIDSVTGRNAITEK